jgi:putative alpha-1,2-mannosidase
VLSAIGFAQVCPADNKFSVNTPLFKKISIKLNKDYHSCRVSDLFQIECDKNPNEYPYISKIILNGEVVDRHYLTYDEITGGGKLELVLSK